jgi:hypothetical protein
MNDPSKKSADWEAYLKRFEPKSEHALQTQLVQWCRIMAKGMVQNRFFAVPNGAFLSGNASKRAYLASKLKAEGMKPGIPDLIFWKGRYVGLESFPELPELLWIELKNGKAGRLSPEQKEVHAALIGAGFTVLVIRTLEEGRNAITEFYQPTKTA